MHTDKKRSDKSTALFIHIIIIIMHFNELKQLSSIINTSNYNNLILVTQFYGCTIMYGTLYILLGVWLFFFIDVIIKTIVIICFIQ